MKKHMLLVILCLSILIVGGVTAYMYFGESERPDYSNEMFVDRGELDGHETMYNLYTTL